MPGFVTSPWAMSLALGCALTLALSMGPRPARADDVADAQAHFERGVRLYQERAYDAALVEFQRAHATAPHPQVLFNIAQVLYQLNEYAEALRTFERYLHEGGREIPAERRAYVRRELSELRERVGTLEVLTDVPGARVLLDEEELGTTPLAPVTVDIGRHVVRVERRGYEPVTHRLQLASGQAERLELSLQPTLSAALESDSPPEDRHQPPRRGRRAALWTLGSLGLALGAGAGTGLALAYRSDGELDRHLRQPMPDAEAVADERTRVRRSALASDVLGAAALAAATGFALTLLLTRNRADDAHAVDRPARTSARLEVGPSLLRVRATF